MAMNMKKGVPGMPVQVEISCIRKTNRTDPHERISFVGGVNQDLTRWSITLDHAISGIESRKWVFWTQGGGKRAEVVVATHNDHKYIKTVADGVQPDNLLALPDCP
jgi:hypothetical protein